MHKFIVLPGRIARSENAERCCTDVDALSNVSAGTIRSIGERGTLLSAGTGAHCMMFVERGQLLDADAKPLF